MNQHSPEHYAPFIAINQFMLPDYRQEVLALVLKNLKKLQMKRRNSINQLIRSLVKIPGFRNSDLAPVGLKIRHSGTVFEKNSEFVAQLLSAWSELNSELGIQVYDILTGRGWEVLPKEYDRAQLPGFLIQWPENETYSTLDAAFSEKYPQSSANHNDIRLMAVWLSVRLPYDMASDEPDLSE